MDPRRPRNVVKCPDCPFELLGRVGPGGQWENVESLRKLFTDHLIDSHGLRYLDAVVVFARAIREGT